MRVHSAFQIRALPREPSSNDHPTDVDAAGYPSCQSRRPECILVSGMRAKTMLRYLFGWVRPPCRIFLRLYFFHHDVVVVLIIIHSYLRLFQCYQHHIGDNSPRASMADVRWATGESSSAVSFGSLACGPSIAWSNWLNKACSPRRYRLSSC